jgi:hypothetical protein
MEMLQESKRWHLTSWMEEGHAKQNEDVERAQMMIPHEPDGRGLSIAE